MKFNPEHIEKNIKRKNTRNKIIRTIIYCIIIPIIIYNILLIIQSFIKKDETPSFLGYKSFVIISGSMEPNLNIGDIIIIKKDEQKEIEKGKIISFRQGQSIITHRVEEVVEENGEVLYRTKGDNNNVADKNLIEYGQIEGIYVTHISKLGNVILALKNKIVIFSILITLYIIYSHNLSKERKIILRKQKREEYEKKRREL